MSDDRPVFDEDAIKRMVVDAQPPGSVDVMPGVYFTPDAKPARAPGAGILVVDDSGSDIARRLTRLAGAERFHREDLLAVVGIERARTWSAEYVGQLLNYPVIDELFCPPPRRRGKRPVQPRGKTRTDFGRRF